METAMSLNIDRLARQAMRETKNELPDLIKEGFPFDPGWVNIVVEGIPPRTRSDGGIETVETSQEAEAIQCTVARVLKCGPAAMDGVTASGIKLSNLFPDV